MSGSLSHCICKRFQPGDVCFGFHRIGSKLPKNKNGRSISSTSTSTSFSMLSSSLSLQGLLPLASLSPLPRQRMRGLSRNSNIIARTTPSTRRSYFTNGEATKKGDPYAILGLEWGDGATTAEIRKAFRERAKSLHPDVVDTTVMTTDQAHEEFQKLVAAYESLMKHVQADDCENMEEWRVSLWRQSDRIALDRTDVAGVARNRPAKPAMTAQRMQFGRELGHPNGKGVATRGEYLSDGATNAGGKKLRSSSVGRGQSKWVKTKQIKEYKEWQPS
mmetsp:Transcript_11857/g.25039  ORF Transcript_11857/g.25039 Transcript_11857/m.25039 type:complete len:275 (+) Transcript_11857:159-983(+)